MAEKIEAKGSILKEARQAKGLSLEYVHEATKIPMDVLHAIEEGYRIKTLSPFYFRGFLKLYAKYLNVDPATVLGDVQVEKRDETYTESQSGIDILSILGRVFTRRRKKQIGLFLAVALSVFVVVKLFGFVFSHVASSSEKKGDIRKEHVKNEEKTDKKQKEKAAAKEKAKKEEAQKEMIAARESAKEESSSKESVSDSKEKSSGVTLTVRARKEGWLKVKADGKVIFQSTLKQGAVETWTADEKVEISGKNINQLEFDLNGRMIGTLGRSDRGAKEVVITKEGLTVTK